MTPFVLALFLAFAPLPAWAEASVSRTFSNAHHLGAGLGHIDPDVVCPGLLAEAEERGDGRALLPHDPLAMDAGGHLVPPADIDPARGRWQALPEASIPLGESGGSAGAILDPPAGARRGILLTPAELAEFCPGGAR